MKIVNSTTWPDWFLRRMLSWCCKALEMGIPRHSGSRVLEARFRNSRSAWGGRARYWRGITVCVGKTYEFPCKSKYNGVIADREECLVEVTAHELAHLLQHAERAKTRLRGGWGGSEPATEWHAFNVLTAFREQRDALLALWSIPPASRHSGPVLSTVERRAQKAARDLERWQRKLKLAQTKVRKLKTRVNYYRKKTSQ